MILQCHNNELIRIPNDAEEYGSYLLEFESNQELMKADTFTIFIGDDIIWSNELKDSVKINENKIIIPVGWLIKKYKKVNDDNISILIRSDQPVTFKLEFQ